MGAAESKPSQSHIFKASGPSSVSQDLLDTLQSTNETDASRSRLIESQVQARVAAELKALEKQQNEALVAAHAKLAAAPADDKDGKESKMSNAVVGKQLEGLRGKLEARKQLRDLPGEVEAARGDMVRCLTENDRRPLDCYAEVQRFKAEVRKMEQEWVNRVTA